MIFKQIDFSKITSQYSKLSNVIERYNGLQSKSQSFQNQYNKVLQNSTSSIGKYLQSLNGAEASLSGYIKYLVATKASTVALTIATTVMKTALITGISVGISLLVQQISKWIHAQEEARQKAIELTNSYKEQRDSLNSQIKKYKELKGTLDNGNLSTDETRSIKEQLLEIQKSLIESYGDEASNIDLVNGKYREQLGLLGELSKEKADEYVKENRSAFEDAKKELEKIRTYKIGSIFSYGGRDGMSDAQKQLYDYINSYSELFEIRNMYDTSTLSNSDYAPTLFVNANADDAKIIIDQFYDDIERYIKENNLQLDYNSLQIDLSKVSSNIETDAVLKEYREIYDEFMKAEVVRNDTLRPLYQQSIQAVEDYNNALSSGEGVTEAKANLDSVQQSVKNTTGELEGSQAVFDGIYNGINKNAESAYNLSQAFENDETVKEYAEHLKGLTDTDLKAINFEDNVKSPGEDAFGALIGILGLSEEEVQNLINKLVELGYVQGEVQDSASNPDSFTLFSGFTEAQSQSIDDFQSKIKTLGDALSSLQSGDALSLTDLIQEFPELAGQSGNLEQAIQQLIYNALQQLYDLLGKGLPADVKNDLQALADEASGVTPDLDEAFAAIRKSHDAMHEFKDAMDTDSLTESILSDVGALSPYMNRMVAQFHSGTISAGQLYQALVEHYNTDLSNYGNALIAKNRYSEEFYNAVGLTGTELINSFLHNYAEAYTTLLSGNYSSSELLDSIQSINKAATDMGESIDWESVLITNIEIRSDSLLISALICVFVI